MAIEQRWTMESTDILSVGEKLGYKWNDVCDEVSDEGLHGEDGDGSVTLKKGDIEELDSEPLKVIFRHIFATNPSMAEILIVDN